MRVTNSMMVTNLVRNMQENTKRLERYNTELSTGKKILKPSDDPVSTLRSMQVNSVLAENDQYKDNIGQAVNWMETTDSVLGNLTDTLNRLREIAVMTANGTYEQGQLDATNDEVMQLRDHVLQLANTSLSGRYLFSGYRTNTKAYTAFNTPYQGDSNRLTVEIGKGIDMEYSIPGDQVFDQLFNTINNMVTFLQTGDQANIANTTLGELNNSLDQLLTTRAGFGAKVRRLEMSLNRLEDIKITHTQLLSDLEDVDVAGTIMNMRMQENVYRAALSSGARIIQPSLIDYLK